MTGRAATSPARTVEGRRRPAPVSSVPGVDNASDEHPVGTRAAASRANADQSSAVDPPSALRSFVGTVLRSVGFVPVASKLRPPRRRRDLVSRSAILGEIGDRDVDVLLVTAAAGYGKTTTLTELVAADEGPCAWVSLDGSDNDAAVLLTNVALALDDVEPVDPGVVWELWGRSPSVSTPALQRFGLMLAGRRRAVLLVLDDVHELVSRDALDVLAMLVSELPDGSTVVLAGRLLPPIGYARFRVRRRVVEWGVEQLAFGVQEAATLFAGRGLDVSTDEARRLVGRTEGWPLALHLASIDRRGDRLDEATVIDPSGQTRLIAEYLAEVLLADLPAETVSFLMAASCLDRLSGPLCDAVLDREGSALLLEELLRGNRLIVALDDHREWYRLHQTFSEFLRAELARRDPARMVSVHRRASEWFEHHGDIDAAITHAVRGGDSARTETLIYTHFAIYATNGRQEAIDRWLGLFTDEQLAARPLLMVAAAYARLFGGDGAAAAGWMARLEDVVGDDRPDGVTGWVPAVALAELRAAAAPITAGEMADEAGYAYRHLPPNGDWQPAACVLRGAAEFMLGHHDLADDLFREGTQGAADRPIVQALGLAHHAVLRVERDDWAEATRLARRARALIDARVKLPVTCLVIALSSLVEAHHGHRDAADRDRRLSRQHLAGYADVAPWTNLQARIALARTSVLLDDPVEAATLLDELEPILGAVSDAVAVAGQVSSIRRALASRSRHARFGPSSLTTAERRVLQYLPTHLSLAEIAERLYVSRNTVKAHTIAIYRKLGTASRSEAVAAAHDGGLLAIGDAIESTLSDIAHNG